MRKSLTVIIFLLAAISATAQIKWNAMYQSYIDQYKDLAIEEMLKYNVPASITLAQGIFESGAGCSYLARKGNNHFGIKCHDWQGHRIYRDDDAKNECFRSYNNVYESYEDHSKFLANNRRYRPLFSLKRTDYRGWAKGLKACGYATNPQYAQRLIDVIELYRLYEYDKAKTYDKFLAECAGRNEVERLHPIRIYNKNYYLKARSGDTFRSIAKEVGVNYRILAKCNERNKNDMLEEGDIVYLKKKQSRAIKDYKNRPHKVKAGESMYSIAQLYGIKLKSLYKMNKLSPNYQIKVGDELRVR